MIHIQIICNYNNLISHVQINAIIKTPNKNCGILTKWQKPQNRIQTHFCESQELFEELDQLEHMLYEESFTCQTIEFH